ncbi:ABC transporter permease [Enterococcus sp. BWR-S5]|uniref:ABC transporter permease n=1 Tax=Enterococcus sp. BWR-S5 TaxID=2787714 RepID=UPI001920D62C|nr:ABC transporter permease subunit [Enterococcus sp. BWR-S5]MBL1225957.1 ABC transporter permease subunit [Enterococcus sp. BWR-S5]
MKKIVSLCVLLVFGIYYLLPLVGTLLYASSTTWTKTVLPDDFTFQWFEQLLADPKFILAIGRSFTLSMIVLLTILLIMVPTIIWINLFFPKISRGMEKIILLPYAIPGVILVAALLRTYSKTGISMFVVLIGALFISALPVVFLGISNQMRLINMKALVDAASTLGASMWTIVFKILLPNIRIGTTLVSLMIFSSVFGEYMLTNLLIGGRFETVRIYMIRRMSENGHLASAVMVLYLGFMIGIALLTFLVTNRQKQLVKRSTEIKEEKRVVKGATTENVFEH